MITISASKAYPGHALITGTHCGGIVTLDELRHMASPDWREECLALASELEPPAEKCERASERMRSLRESCPPPTSRVPGAQGPNRD